jgi:hypothetical protein
LPSFCNALKCSSPLAVAHGDEPANKDTAFLPMPLCPCTRPIPMKHINWLFPFLFLGLQACSPMAANAVKVTYDTYSGYFVSNQFEPKASDSFLVITDKQQFDKVFGVAMVMGDRSHRLATNTFDSNIVLTVVKRGNVFYEYNVEGVAKENDVITLSYTTVSNKNDSASFACPLIVSIPKVKAKTIEFIENRKLVQTLEIGKK